MTSFIKTIEHNRHMKVLKDRIAELESEIKDYRQQIRIYKVRWRQNTRDAERYRWMKTNASNRIWASIQFVNGEYDANDIDSAVDAAMREGEG